MASSRFVEPPDELRACSEAFHAEAMKHLDAVFEEQSYGSRISPYLQAVLTLNSWASGNLIARLVFALESRQGFYLVPCRSCYTDMRRPRISQREQYAD